MARIRTVKPEFWGHPKTARISRDARLLFLGLFNESDDEGRQLGSPKKIAGVVFPNDDDVTPKLITKWLDELEREALIHRYSVEGIGYVLIDGFCEHQKVAHPAKSRLPAPPETRASDARGPREDVMPDLGTRNSYLGSDGDAVDKKPELRFVRKAESA